MCVLLLALGSCNHQVLSLLLRKIPLTLIALAYTMATPPMFVMTSESKPFRSSRRCRNEILPFLLLSGVAFLMASVRDEIHPVILCGLFNSLLGHSLIFCSFWNWIVLKSGTGISPQGIFVLARATICGVIDDARHQSRSSCAGCGSVFCSGLSGREPVAFEAIADKQCALNVCSSPSIVAMKIGWLSSEAKHIAVESVSMVDLSGLEVASM